MKLINKKKDALIVSSAQLKKKFGKMSFGEIKNEIKSEMMYILQNSEYNSDKIKSADILLKLITLEEKAKEGEVLETQRFIFEDFTITNQNNNIEIK